MDLDSLIEKVRVMLDSGYSVGVWGIRHPSQISEVELARKKCSAAGIDFRFKDFMGIYKGEVFGRYRYPSGINSTKIKSMFCRTSELLIGPTGHIYKCHSDLYSNENKMAHISDIDFQFLYESRKCHLSPFRRPLFFIQPMETFAEKWEAFGFQVIEVDGHDVSALQKVFSCIPQEEGKPTAVICRTVKGKGITNLENNPEWHYKNSTTQEEIEGFMNELNTPHA